jgi:hypothetical protein
MEKDTYITEVTFRKFKDGQVIALLPHEVSDYDGNITSYMHIGQHSSATYNHVVSMTKLATPRDYADLLAEMESLGYNIKVISKQNRTKYLANYRELRS